MFRDRLGYQGVLMTTNAKTHGRHRAAVEPRAPFPAAALRLLLGGTFVVLVGLLAWQVL
jgi:hypothetical protein